MRSKLKPNLSTSDLRLLRSSPSVFLAYCGLKAALRDAGPDIVDHSGLVIFVTPPSYRTDDYRCAAEYLFQVDDAVSWTNPGRSKRVYQAPAPRPAKGFAHEISVFDLPDARFVVARDQSDVPEAVRFAAEAIIDVEPPTASHINATRRLLGRPELPDEVADELRKRPQGLVLAGISRCDFSVSDLREIERRNKVAVIASGIVSLPGFEELKSWTASVACDVNKWRSGFISWSEASKGALLAGPPGTGKTMFAQAFADACGFKLITASIGDWEEAGYLNHTLAAMRQSFELAVAANGAVLFIDEMDSLSRRDGLKGEYASYRMLVINQFLSLSSRPMEGVILLGATNYPEHIDPAALRAGRMENRFALSLPGQKERADILAFHLGPKFEPRLLMDAVADLDGSSGADLEKLARDARQKARAHERDLSLEDILSVLPPRKKFSPQQRARLAVHEAGHALIALTLPGERSQGFNLLCAPIVVVHALRRGARKQSFDMAGTIEGRDRGRINHDRC
ncbi:AAA family ATPase [Rhizobium sp. HT1-10]|uniref:AAA family ATPase n=1 Tax=Rhizobium sp. HT1-10 TaxID=3111638 RepID=UPI003C1D3238